jgi:hypothetical protein
LLRKHENTTPKKGILGLFSGLNQLGNCGGAVINDYPQYKTTINGKVNNTIE